MKRYKIEKSGGAGGWSFSLEEDERGPLVKWEDAKREIDALVAERDELQKIVDGYRDIEMRRFRDKVGGWLGGEK